MYQFKAKYQEIKSYPCFNVSKDFTIDNEKKKKNKVKRRCKCFFSVDYNISNILHIHKYLMKET